MRRYRAAVVPGGISDVVHVSRGDNGYTIQIQLVKGGAGYAVPTGANVKLEWAGGSYACSFTGDTVQAPINAEMTAQEGVRPIEVVIYMGDDRIGTANMTLNVEAGA